MTKCGQYEQFSPQLGSFTPAVCTLQRCCTRIVHKHAAAVFVGTIPAALLHHWLAGPLALGVGGARPLPCKLRLNHLGPQNWLVQLLRGLAPALYCMRHSARSIINIFEYKNINIEIFYTTRPRDENIYNFVVY